MRRQQEQSMRKMEAMRKSMESGDPGRIARTRSWRAAGIAMAGLAGWLSQVVEKPVFEVTALDGKYDFDIEVVQYADDTAEYAASQALAKLGLRLEVHKAVTPMLVVDKVERTPAPN
jgi:uncharacterized protein (TIGR03435 family)